MLCLGDCPCRFGVYGLGRILQILTSISADSENDSCRCLPNFETYKYDFVPAFIRLLLPASFCFYSAASSILLSKNGAGRVPLCGLRSNSMLAQAARPGDDENTISFTPYYPSNAQSHNEPLTGDPTPETHIGTSTTIAVSGRIAGGWAVSGRGAEIRRECWLVSPFQGELIIEPAERYPASPIL